MSWYALSSRTGKLETEEYLRQWNLLGKSGRGELNAAVTI
jgi:hypothetical protein